LTNRENNLSNEYITLDLGFASVAGDVWGAMFRVRERLTFEV